MNQLENKKLTEEFITYYKSLTEKEKFMLGSVFNKETGGKLSPYNSPTPVGVALIQIQDGDEIKLVGVIRAVDPKIGEVAFPGGFNNTLEATKEAAAREAKEELGFETNPEDYEYIGERMAPSNNLLKFFKNKNVYPKEILETFKVNSEVSGFVLIDKNTPMAFPFHREIADLFFAEQDKKTIKFKF